MRTAHTLHLKSAIGESAVGCVAQPRTRLDGAYRLRLLVIFIKFVDVRTVTPHRAANRTYDLLKFTLSIRLILEFQKYFLSCQVAMPNDMLGVLPTHTQNLQIY